MADVAAISPRHDQQRGGSAQDRRLVDEVLRCRGIAVRTDEALAAPNGHACVADDQLRPQLDAHLLFDSLSALARKHQVPGAQLAIHHAGTTVAVEVGELRHASGCRVDRDAAFPIGSVGKTFTATLAMILVADGDLQLDAPLGEHVPELGSLGDQLTLRQLLSHTGGFADGPSSECVRTASLGRYVSDHCRPENLVLPPGTGFSYSNMGYVLVGHLIERITGMTWWDAMESILLIPLGIEPGFVGVSGRRPLATGHSVNPAVGRTRPASQSLPLALAPAGGLAMSAVDLVALGLTQLDGAAPALLPTAYAEQMRQVTPNAEPIGWADGSGLGLALFGTADTAWVGHLGRMNGTVSNLRIDPAGRCVVAFTSNANVGVDMWDELVAELRAAGLPIEDYSNREAMPRPIVHSPDCAGSYLNGDIEWSVTSAGTGALSLIDGDAKTELILFDDLSFSTAEQPSTRIGRFLRDPITGEPERMQVTMYVGRRSRRYLTPGMLTGAV
ncbi:MAG: serine hydrolase domain-containing protein [Pseudonocardiaceae bacterium]